MTTATSPLQGVSRDPAHGSPSSPVGPGDVPDLAALRAVDAALIGVEDALRALGSAADAVYGSAGDPFPEGVGIEQWSAAVRPHVAPDAPVPALVALRSLGDRLVAAVARTSLDVQERVEQRLAARAPRSEDSPLSDDSPRSPLRSLSVDRAVTFLLRARGVRAELAGRLSSRVAGLDVGTAPILRVARVVATVAVVMVVGVQVLGIGRASSGSVLPLAAGPSATAPSDAAVGETPPTAGAPRSATAPPSAVAPAPLPTFTRLAPPVSLRVPAIEVDARVVVVGLEPDGAMEIPSDVRTVGWYDPFEGAGVAPGEPGTAVIAGHVDSRTQGRGAFWSLRELAPGDVIDVEHADGTSTRWQVESVVRYPKTDIPIEDIFTFEGDERLALITCGGEFDRSSRAYLDNYVVTAVPVRTAVGGPAQALPTAP